MYASPIDQLSPQLLGLWRELLVARGLEVGPFLHPEFVAAASAVRDKIEVGVLEEGGEIRGFLPFQRGRFRIARPVAGKLCDASGAVLAPGATWDPRAFAGSVGLRAIRLANAPIGDAALVPYQDRPKRIHLIDMADGFEAYRAWNLASGSRFIRQIESRTRKAEKTLGPMRFEWHTSDRSVLERLLAWKSAQRKSSGTPNILDLPWARALVDRLGRTKGDGFEGVLSAVYFGDHLAAAHLGIRTPQLLQYWIPGYDPALGKYSPGLACLMSVAREASSRGIVRIDLGVGEQRFKLRACNATRDVATATVQADPAVGALLSTIDGVRSWARNSAGSQLIQRTARTVARGSYRARSLLR